MRPYIYFCDGRWWVFHEDFPTHGYIFRKNAYERAKTIWKRVRGEEC